MGMLSVLAQAWRARVPNSHYTRVGADPASAGWSTAHIARDAEALADGDWQQLAAAASY